MDIPVISEAIECGDLMPMWCADDGYLAGKPALVALFIHEFHRRMPSVGMEFNASKCEFIQGSDDDSVREQLIIQFLEKLAQLNSNLFKASTFPHPVTATQDWYTVSWHPPAGGPQVVYRIPKERVSPAGIVLGVPVGNSASFISRHIRKTCDGIKAVTVKMDKQYCEQEFSGQVAAGVLSFSTARKLTGLQRNVDPQLLCLGGKEADKQLVDAFVRTSGAWGHGLDLHLSPDNEANQADILQIQLPFRHGGFHVSSVHRAGGSAFVGSYTDFLSLLSNDDDNRYLPEVHRAAFLNMDQAYTDGLQWATILKDSYVIINNMHIALIRSGKYSKIPGDGNWQDAHKSIAGHQTDHGHFTGRMQSTFDFIRCTYEEMQLHGYIAQRCENEESLAEFTRNGRKRAHQSLVVRSSGSKHGRAVGVGLLGANPQAALSNSEYATMAADKLNLPQLEVKTLISRGCTRSANGQDIATYDDEGKLIWADYAGDTIACDSYIPGHHARHVKFHDKQVKTIARYAEHAGFTVQVESTGLNSAAGANATAMANLAVMEWQSRQLSNPAQVPSAQPSIQTSGNPQVNAMTNTPTFLSAAEIQAINDSHKRLDIVAEKDDLRFMADYSHVSETARSTPAGANMFTLADNAHPRSGVHKRQKAKLYKYGQIAEFTGYKLYAPAQSSGGAWGDQFIQLTDVLAREARKEHENDIAYRPVRRKQRFLREIAVNGAIHRARSILKNSKTLGRNLTTASPSNGFDQANVSAAIGGLNQYD